MSAHTVAPELVTRDELAEQRAYIAEASTLGLRPGSWPAHIEIRFPERPELFFADQRIQRYGELMGYQYVSARGATLAVLND